MKTGLTIKTPNLLDRRENLNGIVMRDSVLPYAKISKPVYDHKGNVIKSGGVFQVYHPPILDIIQRWAKRLTCFAEQQPGTARQKFPRNLRTTL